MCDDCVSRLSILRPPAEDSRVQVARFLLTGRAVEGLRIGRVWALWYLWVAVSLFVAWGGQPLLLFLLRPSCPCL